MLGEALITDCRETSAKTSLFKFRQQYQAWGLAILLHLFAGSVFYKIGISPTPRRPIAESNIPTRKIIQVQLVSIAPAAAQKPIAEVTPLQPELKTNPVTKPLLASQPMTLPVKTVPQPELAKLHTTTEKSKNKVKNKKTDNQILKKTDVILSKRSGQVTQKNTQQNNIPTTPARLDTSYLSNPAPEYPAIARELEQEGTVLLQVKVSVTGLVLQIRVHRSSGHTSLDNAAINAVRQWKFVPASAGNVKQEDDVIIPVNFSLEDT